MSALPNKQPLRTRVLVKALIQELNIGNILKIRAIKVVLQNGMVEVLLTSLLSQDEYKTEIFKELYFKRMCVRKRYIR